MINTIIDLGTHNGQDTRMYLEQGYYVFSIDANPFILKDLKKENHKNNKILNIGIGNKDEIKKFYINKLSVWSSFTDWGKNGGDYNEIEAPLVTFKTLFSKYIDLNLHKIKYIKIDIEGYDLLALKSLLETNVRPKYISIESGKKEILDLLDNAGYKRFQYIQQKDNFNKKVKITKKNKHQIDYTLENGSSGPFGKDLDKTKWLDKETVYKQISKVWNDDGTKVEGHIDDIHGWFDLHAKY